jgi:hypothetical protein
MSEDTKKVEKTEQETKAAELSQQDLDKVAGGVSEIVVTKPLTDILISG